MEYPEDEIVRVPATGRAGGEWITIGLDAYRFAPINFEVIKSEDFQADLKVVSGMGSSMPSRDQLAAAERIVLVSLQRNYPQMTAEKVSKLVDLGNSVRVVRAALGISGYVGGAPGASLGETSASTGTASTSP